MWAVWLFLSIVGVIVIVVCVVIVRPVEKVTNLLRPVLGSANVSPTLTPSVDTAKMVVSNRDDHIRPLDALGIVYYINLDHRIDRRQEIEAELDRMGIRNRIRVPGVVSESGSGAEGCTRAHINALSEFLEQEEFDVCTIMEDDLQFVSSKTDIEFMLQEIKRVQDNWDVLLLGSHIRTSECVFDSTGKILPVVRVLKGQTTTGYAVKRRFASTLLKNFQEGLSKYVANPKKRYLIDIHWQKLQTQHLFYAFNPLIAIQRESYSDIVKKVHQTKASAKVNKPQARAKICDKKSKKQQTAHETEENQV